MKAQNMRLLHGLKIGEFDMNDFQKNGYVIVRNAISTELRDFITQYALFDEMQDKVPERELHDSPQVPNAHSKYGDPAMETMLLHLHPIMEQNTGLKLHPTYSYYRVYRNGDDLKPHIDRASCEISATLCFNHSFDAKDYQWPIFMQGNEVNLNPGDMVIYKGEELSHWREPFEYPDDAWQVQGFFHFVDANGPHVEWKWDKRECIGHVNRKRVSVDNKVQKPYIQWL